MGWWKADPVPESPQQPQANTTRLPASHPQFQESDAVACPVDPKTREIWLRQTQSNFAQGRTASTVPVHTIASTTPLASSTLASASGKQCSSDRIDQSSNLQSSGSTPQYRTLRSLSQDREVSSIPRAYDVETLATTDKSNARPSNAEAETGHDRVSGNWIYPSESQFFTAVMRKHPEAASPTELATSISSIIPIHNAVNERAWSMIRKWESGQPANKICGGPKLLKFEGKGAGAKSPRAIMKSWSGYQEPFDRHDWTIQRCDGTNVDYIIDFYQGRSPSGQVSPGGSKGSQGINFYLDVRPKLNSLEGARMRFASFVGWA